MLQLHADKHLDLDAEGLALLVEACRTHTGGRIPAHPTVMACWDSDRLDLPRIHGIQIRPEWLGTAAARDPRTVEWATLRAKKRAFPWEEIFRDPPPELANRHKNTGHVVDSTIEAIC